MPPIIDEETFTAVQGFLQSRNPKRTPPRVVNGPTLLAGVAKCGYCGAALIQNTGKGLYRYYCCSRKLKEGATACRGLRIPMGRLDNIVINELTERVLQPDRLRTLLDECLKTSSERADQNRHRLGQLRQAHKDAEAAIVRLLTLVETGLMEAEDPSLKERLVGLKVQRDELAADLGELQKRVTSGQPAITPEKIEKLGILLLGQLHGGSPEFRQAYTRLAVREVSVRDREIRITGSKAVLARAAAQAPQPTLPAVLSFVREWRTRQNPKKPDSS